eukprot:jgi/Mesvir1/212/Mv13556-RA.1
MSLPTTMDSVRSAARQLSLPPGIYAASSAFQRRVPPVDRQRHFRTKSSGLSNSSLLLTNHVEARSGMTPADLWAPSSARDVGRQRRAWHAASVDESAGFLGTRLSSPSPLLSNAGGHKQPSVVGCRASVSTSADAAVKEGAVAPPSSADVTGSVRALVGQLFARAVADVVPGQAPGDVAPLVAACANTKFGDYQCNNAMPIFQKLKTAPVEGVSFKNPQEVAKAIIQRLPSNELISATSVAGPGFINATISREWIARHISDMLRNGMGRWRPALPPGRAVVDFSSPNIAKEMHVGHLRSTIIGDTIARVLEYAGQDVLRVNHVGDWGTQFGMLIQYLSEDESSGDVLAEGNEENAAGTLQALYKASKKKFDDDPEFKKRAQMAVVKLQSGDESSLATWRRICELSRREFEQIYSRLGIKIQEKGESFYNPFIPDTLKELQSRGLTQVSEGALCVFLEGESVPLIVQKSDGGFNYASTDLTALRYRIAQERANRVIYVTDVGQKQHFSMVFEAAKLAGWLQSDGAPRLDHVGFGLVLGDDGKRFRTRSTEVVRLVDLLDEAKQRCLTQLKERGNLEEGITEEELEAAAAAMGYGAVKYADLRGNRLSNYTFNYDRMLDLKGNTAVYLLYAHVRIASIIRKYSGDVATLKEKSAEAIKLEHTRVNLRINLGLSCSP